MSILTAAVLPTRYGQVLRYACRGLVPEAVGCRYNDFDASRNLGLQNEFGTECSEDSILHRR
jgi:hypothetical protein